MYGCNVKVQFHGTQSSISYYMCKLDSNPFIRCKSAKYLCQQTPMHIHIIPVFSLAYIVLVSHFSLMWECCGKCRGSFRKLFGSGGNSDVLRSLVGVMD